MDNKNIKHIGLFVTLSVILLVLIAFFVVSYTYEYDDPIPLPGHGADEILVDINGDEMTLQEALDEDILGKEYESLWQKGIDNKIYYSGGNVGIGLNNPSAKLDVNGNMNVSGNLNVVGNVVASTPTAASHLATKGYVDDQVVSAGGGAAQYEWSTEQGKMNWYDAMNTCAELTEGGHNDWRLPTISEFDVAHYDEVSGFSGSNYYWSSELYKTDKDLSEYFYFNVNMRYAYTLRMDHAFLNVNARSNDYYVRCVRD